MWGFTLGKASFNLPHRSFAFPPKAFKRINTHCGAIAQLARAPRLHRGGQGFESL